MASLIPGPKVEGRVVRRVSFNWPNERQRRHIRLGRVGLQQGLSIKRNIERLVVAKISDTPWETELAEWVAKLPERRPKLADDLVKHGLIRSREKSTLAGFIKFYTEQRQDVAPSTKVAWDQGARDLLEHFGKERSIHTITRSDALDFRAWLMAKKKKNGKPRRPATTDKRLRFAVMLFGAMAERELIVKNPFSRVSVAAPIDESRNVFVSRETIYRVLDQAPDAEWRLLICLSRFAGLRVPSEALSLEWRHIDWSRKLITVPSPKTKHHAGGGQREIPLFDVLVEPLLDAHEEAAKGAVYVISKHRSQADSQGGWRSTNVRKPFSDIIKKAGMEPWPKLWHALRASFETELVERTPIQSVAKFMGHSPRVAVTNYLRPLPEHIDQARNLGVEAHQKAHQHNSALPCIQNREDENSRGNNVMHLGAPLCIPTEWAILDSNQ
ncbi:MAG: site-specific integrase [Planctomycetales bacterium]|nr:site-specific integrase [Planctomycetales bacterium]